jgi:alpha-1,6-mannosyltransferase
VSLLSLAGYIVVANWFPLRPYYNHSPSPDIRLLAPTLADAGKYAALLLLLTGLYWIAYRLVTRREKGLSLAAILGVAALFCIPLILAFPINATDVYRYFIRGRISQVHHENPFIVPVASLADEPYAALAGEWAGETSPYGPIWEAVASLATGLAPDNLWLSLLFFKCLAGAFFLLIGGLIWLALKDVAAPRRAGLTLLWAWNPSLLFIFAMDGHNDALMITWLLLGWLIMKRGRIQLGMIILLLAPLTKPIGLLAIPYFFIFGWRQLAEQVARFRYLATTVVSGLAILWLSFLPFGSPLDLARRLLSEAGSGGGFSPLALIILELRERGFDPAIDQSTRLATLLFALLAIWLVWLTWHGRSPLRAAADIFAGYIVQAFRFRIWYAVWPFPWLLLDRGRESDATPAGQARLAAGLTLLLTSQLSVLIYGHLRIEIFGASHLRAHRAGVLFTFGLPLLVALVVAFYNARLRERHKEK